MGAALNCALYLQIEPQPFWHAEATIRGNKAALLALAEALTKAANGDAAVTDTMFCSDGEGYEVIVQRVERPDDFPPPFYTAQIEHLDYKAAGKDYCGKCGRPK